MKVLSSEELEKKWDLFSKTFMYYVEPSTLPVCLLLMTNLGITNKYGSKIESVFECGSGAGAGTQLCFNYLDKSTKLVSSDISNEMVKLSKERLSKELSESINNNLNIIQCNAEQLPFKNGEFDRYFSNFVLHLVNDPNKMLSESYRVLADGGYSAFSVWGRPENSLQYCIVGKMAKECGIDTGVPNRSAFHLSDINTLRQMALDAGYSSVQAGYSFFPTPIHNGTEYAELFLSPPEYVTLGEKIGKEKFNLWKSKIISYVDSILDSGNLIGLEVAHIICKK